MLGDQEYPDFVMLLMKEHVSGPRASLGEPTQYSRGHLDRRTAATQWRTVGMEAAAWSTGHLRMCECAQNEVPNAQEAAACEMSNCRMYRWCGRTVSPGLAMPSPQERGVVGLALLKG